MAINRSATGQTTIRLNVPLRTHIQTQDTPTATVMPRRRGSGDTGTGQASTSLMGMLHHLWESAQLHTWQPGMRRRWGECAEKVHARTGATCINGQPLDEVLYVVPPYAPAMAAANNASLKTWRARIGRPGHRGLLLGEIKTVQPSRYGHQARLWHLRPAVYLRTQLWERARRSYRSALAENAPEHVHRVVLWAVEITRAGYLHAVDVAVLLTSRTYVPADSGHEVKMAEALTRAGRSFVKPLRFDTTSHEVLPDFLLTDTDPPTCVEVYGMLDNPDYVRRQRAKRAYYHSNGIPLIEWDVRATLPALRP